jgi:hypothetical protein
MGVENGKRKRGGSDAGCDDSCTVGEGFYQRRVRVRPAGFDATEEALFADLVQLVS